MGVPFITTLAVCTYTASSGYALYVASITALVRLVPGATLLLFAGAIPQSRISRLSRPALRVEIRVPSVNGEDWTPAFFLGTYLELVSATRARSNVSNG